jgi:hypothetical protein
MKRLSLFCLGIFCLGLFAGTADSPANFSGTWILDTKNSDPFPHPVMGLSGGLDMSGGDISANSSGGRMGGTPPSSRDMGGGRGGGMTGRMPGGRSGRGPVATTEEPPMLIRQSETELEISRTAKVNGQDVPVVDKYKTDGSEVISSVPIPNSPDRVKISTKAKLKKNKLVIQTTNYYPQGKSTIKREYTLSKDGKTLTLNTTNVGARGQLVQKQIFLKQ